MMRETRKPFSSRHAFMQKVARAVVDYWRASPELSAPDQRMASAGAASGTAR